jgi:hypothetical protein
MKVRVRSIRFLVRKAVRSGDRDILAARTIEVVSELAADFEGTVG